MRGSGILLPVSSLPSKYGIGCFSSEAYDFVDKLVRAGQKYWQILPLGPIGYGDSPYQSFSTFAGNPYYIDLDRLVSYGWLMEEECAAIDFGQDESRVDYGKLYQERFRILRKAFLNSKVKENPEFIRFCEEQSAWLADYALYMAIKIEYDNRPWDQWEDDLKERNTEALDLKREQLGDEILFYEFLQYEFRREWNALKEYANAKGIRIIGDIPIYVSFDSADAWAHKELFQFDEFGRPIAVAGCPPDGFSADGQLWGNPLYNWEYHRSTQYEWWMKRLGFCFSMYDIVRIDHFRGFDEYFSVPYGDVNAKNGHWEKGPGIDLFRKVKELYPDAEIIAEDLGYVTDSVRQLVRDTGYPGMKVLEFAFDSRDTGSAVDYLPHNYEKNSVVYTGTHDNETVVGWYREGLLESERHMVRDYFRDHITPDDQIHKTLICGAMASAANLCIIPMQDLLGLDNSARMNTPSTSGTNWKWRLNRDGFSDDVIKKLCKLTKLYGR